MTRLNARRMVSVRWRAHPMVPKPVDVEIAVASHGSKSSDAAARFRRSGPTAMRGFREIALHSTRFSWGDRLFDARSRSSRARLVGRISNLSGASRNARSGSLFCHSQNSAGRCCCQVWLSALALSESNSC